MNYDKSKAYMEYQQKAKEASKIASELRSLYGVDMAAEHIMVRARIDGIVNEEEISLLRQFNSL